MAVVSGSEVDESEPSPRSVSHSHSQKGPISGRIAMKAQDDGDIKPSADPDEVGDEDADLVKPTSRKRTKRAQPSQVSPSMLTPRFNPI